MNRRPAQARGDIVDYVLAFLCLVAVVGAFLTLETEKRQRAMIALFVANAAVGLLFMRLNAMYAASFQLLIYAGVLVILFLSTSALLEHHKEVEPFPEATGAKEVVQ